VVSGDWLVVDRDCRGSGIFRTGSGVCFSEADVAAGVGANLPDDTTMEYVVAFGIGLAIIGIFSMVFALFAPKSKNRKLVSESTLKNQKDEMNAERQRAKRRKLQMQSKMKKTRREQNSE
jgi:hypothetical protein